MNINLTLVGQSIAFALFVWFCMRYVWPPMMTILRERQQRITEGLEMAQQSEKALVDAKQRAQEELGAARTQGAEVLAQADKQAKRIVEEAKQKAQEEARRQQELAAVEIEQERNRAREELREHLSDLVIQGAEKVLRKSVDAKAHKDTLTKLTEEL